MARLARGRSPEAGRPARGPRSGEFEEPETGVRLGPLASASSRNPERESGSGPPGPASSRNVERESGSGPPVRRVRGTRNGSPARAPRSGEFEEPGTGVRVGLRPGWLPKRTRRRRHAPDAGRRGSMFRMKGPAESGFFTLMGPPPHGTTPSWDHPDFFTLMGPPDFHRDGTPRGRGEVPPTQGDWGFRRRNTKVPLSENTSFHLGSWPSLRRSCSG